MAVFCNTNVENCSKIIFLDVNGFCCHNKSLNSQSIHPFANYLATTLSMVAPVLEK